MPDARGRAALLITGTVGTGKTSVAEHVGELLASCGTPHAIVDFDHLRRAWPAPVNDPFNNALELVNLSSVAHNYWAVGARRLVMAGVIEHRTALAGYERAVACAVTVVRLRARSGVVIGRLRRRHQDDPEGLAWHLARAPELDTILDEAAVTEAEVDTSVREPREVAAQVLLAAGW